MIKNIVALILILSYIMTADAQSTTEVTMLPDERW